MKNRLIKNKIKLTDHEEAAGGGGVEAEPPSTVISCLVDRNELRIILLLGSFSPSEW